MSERLSYRQLVRRYPAFRRLWLGDVASFLGDWFNLIALYTSVRALDSSSLAISLVVAAKTVPNFLVIPIAGPVVDRFDRRRLLLAADLFRALCTVGLILSHRGGSLAGLYGFTLAMVACTGVAMPAKKASIPMLVPREHVGVANALAGGTWSVMLAVGAALGGAAVAELGVTTSFAVDGATFLVSALFFRGLPPLRAPAAEAGRAAGFRDGLRYLARTPYIAAVVALKPMMAIANSVVLVAIPIYGTERFAGVSGPLYMGLLYAARGAGAAAGSLGLRLIFGDSPRALRRLIAVGYLTVAGALTLVAHAPALWVAALGFFLAALGSGGNWVFTGTLLQLEADRSYHGRIFSLEFGVATLILGGGAPLVGAIEDAGLSIEAVVQLWALFAVPPALFWIGVLVVLRKRLRARVEAHLSAAYAAAAEEPHDLARSRQYRHARLLQASEADGELDAIRADGPAPPGSDADGV